MERIRLERSAPVWGSDPFAFGSYSFVKLGSEPRHYDELRAPLAKRLYFAGEATIKEHYGTVHGAYLSGVRTARELMEQVGAAQ